MCAGACVYVVCLHVLRIVSLDKICIMCAGACVYVVCLHVLRIVSLDKIGCCINTILIIYCCVVSWLA